MKKFLSKIVLFFVLLIVVDLLCGYFFKMIRNYARGGKTYKYEYISNVCTDDILILGSSRAENHYVPIVFEDSLGLSCYNAGEKGCGIIPAYVRYKMVSERKKPKLVLYEITPQYDYQKDNNYSQYLGTIRQFADRKIVREVLLDFSDELEGLRLLSNFYKNNSRIVSNISDVFGKGKSIEKGYNPLYGVIDPSVTHHKPELFEKAFKDIDSLKLFYMKRLISETNEDSVPVIFMLSPEYMPDYNNSKYKYAFEIAQRNNLPLIDNRNCPGISGKKDYFRDAGHLNNKGAVKYSQYVVAQLKKYIILANNNRDILE